MHKLNQLKEHLARSKEASLDFFVTFRPNENIRDEVSVTSGHVYKSSSVTAKSGKNNFSLFSQSNFAWLLDEKEEQKFIKVMKRATNLMIIGGTKDGAQTTDHYSMMGFTKAYNTAKKLADNEKNSSCLFWWTRHINNSQMVTKNFKAEVIAYTADIGQKINRKKLFRMQKNLV